MQIGKVIRKYRKGKSFTQEEMAKRLGVTAPAVNKWENGNTLPDVSLLSPIARLLNISTDVLLSHENELSDADANRLIEEANARIKTEPLHEVFQWMKQCLEEYPNSDYLTLWMARIFDSRRLMLEIPDAKKYDSYISGCYERVLGSENQELKTGAAEALYYFYFHNEQYNEAEKYLPYFSQESPERKRKQGMIYSKTGRKSQAHKAYEELLYTGYESMNATLQSILMLLLEDAAYDKAHMVVEKLQGLARLFEFGEFHEVSPALELATLEKSVPETLYIMERMLTNLESISAFTKSSLYSHMDFKEPSEEYLAEIRESLIKGFQDTETYAYLQGNPQWIKLLG